MFDQTGQKVGIQINAGLGHSKWAMVEKYEEDGRTLWRWRDLATNNVVSNFSSELYAYRDARRSGYEVELNDDE